jgi:DNA relaxase NicK
MNEYVSVYRRGTANNRNTTCFDIPGSGLRDLPKIDIIKLCRFVIDNGGNITRFDATADDLGNILPFDDMVKLCLGENFKERVRTKLCRNRKDKATGEMLQTLPTVSIQPRRIQFGSEKSDNYAVVYDKEYVSGISFPFMRVELRLTERKDTVALAKELASGIDPGPYLAGVIRGKLDFLRLDNDSKQRRSSTEWWLKFLNNAQAQKLKREPTKPGKPNTNSKSADIAIRHIEKLMRQENGEGLRRVIGIVDKPEVSKIAYPGLNF